MGSRHQARKKQFPPPPVSKVPHKFAVDERVLCYEPDKSKARVLYDSKILEVVEKTNRKKKTTVEYKIHFFGWNSSWDRYVTEDCVLKDTNENRKLQKELKAKADILIQSHLKKKNGKKTLSEVLKEVAKEKEGKAPKPANKRRDGRDGGNPSRDSDSSSSDYDSSEDEEERKLVAHILLTDPVRTILERDYYNILNNNMLVRVPADITVIFVFEEYVKFFGFRELKKILEKWRTTFETGNFPSTATTCTAACLSPLTLNPNYSASRFDTPIPDPFLEDIAKIYRKIRQAQQIVYGLKTIFDYMLYQVLLYDVENEQYKTYKRMRPKMPVIDCIRMYPHYMVVKNTESNTPTGKSTAPATETNTPTAKSNPTTAIITTPTAELNKPASESSKPAAESSKPAAESSKPAAESSKPAVESSKPAAESSKPAAESSKPAAESSKPASESSKPAAESSKPAAESSKPAAESNKPTAELNKSSAESNKPNADSNKPAAESSKPIADSNIPAAGSNKPIADSNKPAAELNKPIPELNKPIPEPSNPTADSNKPIAESNKPAADSNQPTPESCKPTPESNKSTAESDKPAAESNKPTAESNTSTGESSKATAESNTPAGESCKPTAESNTSTGESSTPTAESSKPTAESNTSTGKSSKPTAESNTSFMKLNTSPTKSDTSSNESNTSSVDSSTSNVFKMYLEANKLYVSLMESKISYLELKSTTVESNASLMESTSSKSNSESQKSNPESHESSTESHNSTGTTISNPTTDESNTYTTLGSSPEASESSAESYRPTVESSPEANEAPAESYRRTVESNQSAVNSNTSAAAVSVPKLNTPMQNAASSNTTEEYPPTPSTSTAPPASHTFRQPQPPPPIPSTSKSPPKFQMPANLRILPPCARRSPNDPYNLWTKKTEQYVKDLSAWRMLPSDCYAQEPPDPSMVYGLVHLLRLFVKLPDILNRTLIPRRKVRIIAHHVNMMVDHIQSTYAFPMNRLYVKIPKSTYEEDQIGFGAVATEADKCPAKNAEKETDLSKYHTRSYRTELLDRAIPQLPKVVEVPLFSTSDSVEEHTLTVSNYCTEDTVDICADADYSSTATTIVPSSGESNIGSVFGTESDGSGEASSQENMDECPKVELTMRIPEVSVTQQSKVKTEAKARRELSPPVSPVARKIRKSAADAKFKTAHIFNAIPMASRVVPARRDVGKNVSPSPSASRKRTRSGESPIRESKRVTRVSESAKETISSKEKEKDESPTIAKRSARDRNSRQPHRSSNTEQKSASRSPPGRRGSTTRSASANKKEEQLQVEKKSGSTSSSKKATTQKDANTPDKQQTDKKTESTSSSTPYPNFQPGNRRPVIKLKKLEIVTNSPPPQRVSKSNSTHKEPAVPTKTPQKTGTQSATTHRLRSRSDERQLRSKGQIINALSLPSTSRSSMPSKSKERSPTRRESSGQTDPGTSSGTNSKHVEQSRSLRRSRR